jgi:hypothetical protein
MFEGIEKRPPKRSARLGGVSAPEYIVVPLVIYHAEDRKVNLVIRAVG